MSYVLVETRGFSALERDDLEKYYSLSLKTPSLSLSLKMWRKGKKRADERPFGGDSDGAPQAKRFAKGDSDEDGVVVCEVNRQFLTLILVSSF